MDHVHLSDADAFTLHLERDPLLRSTIVAVARLDRAPDWDRFCTAMERATRLEPNFRRRLEPGAGALVPPRWRDVDHFDLSWHLRRVSVPKPRTFDQVLELARIAGTTAFDPERPRWEFTVVEDLADGTAALVMKVHHALTDGIGGIQLAAHVVDLDRRATRRPDVPPPEPVGEESGLSRLTDAATHDLRRAVGLATGVVGAVPRMARAWSRRPLRVWEDAAGAAASVLRFVRPITSTSSPVMRDRKLGWRYHAFDVPLPALRRAGELADGSVNDAFLGGLAGGLARYHALHDADVEALRITMPISTRGAEDAPGGNRITLVRFPIPLGDHDPVSRMLAIDHTAQRWRHEPAIGWAQAIAGALNLLPTSVSGGMLKHVDVVASNVPGFDQPVFVAGARVEHFHAFGPTLGSAANVTLMSYRGRCCIGVTTDDGAVPDHDAFVECLRAGFDEMVELSAT